MSHTNIARQYHGYLPVRYSPWQDAQTLAGEFLEMTDGSVWFHPYNGWRPVQHKPGN